MVRVHGNWCGPNWTGGKKLSAEDYAARGLSWDSPCSDKLDCACRDHDKACSGPKGCSRSADTKLIKAAEKLQLSAFRSTSLEISLLNPRLSAGTRRRNKKLLELDRKADLIIDAIAIARLTRRH